jgi:hypothetical protein
MRIRIHTADFDQIPSTTRFGLYLIRATKAQALCRLGCSGVSHTNKGEAGLKARLDQHKQPLPKNPTNLALRNQPWHPLWACELLWPDDLKIPFMIRLTKFAELAMFGHFAGIYAFDFTEQDNSIFHHESAFDRVQIHINLFEERLRALLRLQVSHLRGDLS